MPEGMARAVRDISDVERHIMVTTGCNVSRVWSNVPARPQGELFSEGTARVIVDAKAKADVVMSKTGCRVSSRDKRHLYAACDGVLDLRRAALSVKPTFNLRPLTFSYPEFITSSPGNVMSKVAENGIA